ncbi:MAG: hypothetical protein ACE5GA_01535 [Candidatus Zixiibacteriota bacterium]
MSFPTPGTAERMIGAQSTFRQLLRPNLLLAYGLFVCVVCSQASGRVLEDDPGVPDTILVPDVSVNAGDHFPVTITMVNDEELSGGTVGIAWGTPDLFLDSISFVGSVVEFLPPNQRPTTIDNVSFLSLTGFFLIFDDPIPVGKGALARLWFTASAGAPDQFIDLDSAFVPPNGDFILVALDGNVSFTPQYVGGRVKIGNPSEPSTIATDPGSFRFDALVGNVNPPAQSMQITNVGLGTLNWSASVSSAWLSLAPASGSAPSLVQVRANSIGLPVGTFSDEIVITDPNATNSPFVVPVVLEVIEPPPIISVSPSAFFFNAIADSTNPPPQSLIIKNAGVAPLNWQAVNNEPWLTVTPSSGIDSSEALLIVDVTGLPFGEYFDTITVSDPEASNSPVRVPVNLSVASDLPIIRIEPDTLVIVVDIGANPPGEGAFFLDSGFFSVLNDGAGNLTFSLSESSSRVLGLTPDSGAAPQSVLVSMRYGNPVPGELFDVIQVSSPQAINSPQEIVVRSHVTSTAATLSISADTVDFSLFECEQGLGFVPKSKLVGISTFGESVPYTLSFDADWLISQSTAGIAPGSFAIKVRETGLPLGVYLDSIRVDAPLAEENPKYVFVRLTIKPGDVAPLILPSLQTMVLAARAGTDFQFGPIGVLGIRNQRGGCFDWEIDNQVPWLTIEPTSGTNPGSIRLIPDGTTLSFGQLTDQFSIVSAEADDSPELITVRLNVWTLFGDANYSGRINVADVTYLIAYLFANGPPPEPVIEVGDTNCSGLVNVADITFLILRLFSQGPTPCGNPGLSP